MQVTLSKKMVDIAVGPVDAAEAAVTVATTAAAVRYAEISKAISVRPSPALSPRLIALHIAQ
jgi:hypothetical protein